uniref:Uncharacterized protein n=1 Tax=Panagrolaimus superbus TaxID=310955 RepID=A0A914YK01_9BILA
MNFTLFETTYFPGAKTNSSEKVCTTGCKDIEWLLTLISTKILQSLTNPSARIRKKRISIITNYYYASGFDEILYSTFYDKFNLTFLYLFVPSKDFLDLPALEASSVPITIFDMSDKNMDFTKANEKYLNQFIGLFYFGKCDLIPWGPK